MTDPTKETREERLAKALRANLARRKARDRLAVDPPVTADAKED